MFAYALVCFLDDKTNEFFSMLWNDLNKCNITNYGVYPKARKPHITIADYNNLDKNKFISLLDEFYNDKFKIDLELNVIGSFMGSSTLFMAPTLTKDLLRFHNNYHAHFELFNDNNKSFYLPGKWSPHCTIASRLNNEELEKAFRYCATSFKKINCQITEIALLEIKLDEKNIAVDDKVIFLKQFK